MWGRVEHRRTLGDSSYPPAPSSCAPPRNACDTIGSGNERNHSVRAESSGPEHGPVRLHNPDTRRDTGDRAREFGAGRRWARPHRTACPAIRTPDGPQCVSSHGPRECPRSARRIRIAACAPRAPISHGAARWLTTALGDTVTTRARPAIPAHAGPEPDPACCPGRPHRLAEPIVAVPKRRGDGGCSRRAAATPGGGAPPCGRSCSGPARAEGRLCAAPLGDTSETERTRSRGRYLCSGWATGRWRAKPPDPGCDHGRQSAGHPFGFRAGSAPSFRGGAPAVGRVARCRIRHGARRIPARPGGHRRRLFRRAGGARAVVYRGYREWPRPGRCAGREFPTSGLFGRWCAATHSPDHRTGR